MYWIGIIITFCIFLLSIEIMRRPIVQNLPNLNDTTLDIILIVIFIVGLGITTIKYLLDQREIKNLQTQVDISKYQEVAEYNATGNKSGKVSGVPMVRTPINDWNKKYFFRRESEIGCNCSEDFMSQCQSVIQ